MFVANEINSSKSSMMQNEHVESDTKSRKQPLKTGDTYNIGKVIKAFLSHLMSFEIKSQVEVKSFSYLSRVLGVSLDGWCGAVDTKIFRHNFVISSFSPTNSSNLFHHFFCISHSHRLCTFTREQFESYLNLEASSFECRNWVVFEQSIFLCNFKKLKSQISCRSLSSTFFSCRNVESSTCFAFHVSSFQKIWHYSICDSLCHICPFKHREF